MQNRPPGLWLGLGTLVLVTILASLALAQGARRRTPRPPAAPASLPMAGTLIDWSIFVSAYGDAPSSRSPVPTTVMPVTLPESTGWSCSVGTPTRAAVDSEHWSEVRTLECRRGDSILSTNGFCQVIGSSWGARAAVLSLGSASAEERIQLTVDCSVRN